MTTSRFHDRAPDQLRPTVIEAGFMRSATGSALISMGETRVICTASWQPGVPKWLSGSGRGWVTAEYGMLPASTGDRKQRDVTRGRPDGRTVEIQRLIGRAVVGARHAAAPAGSATRSTSPRGSCRNRVPSARNASTSPVHRKR